MSPRVALILGAGPNIGAALTTAFSSRGYAIALASRSADASNDSASKIHVKVDLSQPETVKTVFDEVEKKLGVPGVVVYNAAAATFTSPTDPTDPSKLSVERFAQSLTINTVSLYAAAQATVAAWAKLEADASPTFIYTGNGLMFNVLPALLDLGVGKTASGHVIRALSEVYGGRGWKFYFADERYEDGSYATNVGGDSAAEFYPTLVEGKKQGLWYQTFVKGKGYVDFGKK